MIICNSTLPRVTTHTIGTPKSPFVLLEFMRLGKQSFRRGWAFGYRRNRPIWYRPLPIVPLDPPKLDGYGSRYPNPKWDMNRPMSSTPLDLV